MNTYRFQWRDGLTGVSEGETPQRAFSSLQDKVGKLTRYDTYEVLNNERQRFDYGTFSSKSIDSYRDEVSLHGDKHIAKQHTVWSMAKSEAGKEVGYKQSWHVANQSVEAYERLSKTMPPSAAKEAAVKEIVNGADERFSQYRQGRSRTNGMEL